MIQYLQRKKNKLFRWKKGPTKAPHEQFRKSLGKRVIIHDKKSSIPMKGADNTSLNSILPFRIWKSLLVPSPWTWPEQCKGVPPTMWKSAGSSVTAFAFLESRADTTALDSYLIIILNLRELQPVFAFLRAGKERLSTLTQLHGSGPMEVSSSQTKLPLPMWGTPRRMA